MEECTVLPVFALTGFASQLNWLTSILIAAIYVPATAGVATAVAGVTCAVPHRQ